MAVRIEWADPIPADQLIPDPNKPFQPLRPLRAPVHIGRFTDTTVPRYIAVFGSLFQGKSLHQLLVSSSPHPKMSWQIEGAKSYLGTVSPEQEQARVGAEKIPFGWQCARDDLDQERLAIAAAMETKGGDLGQFLQAIRTLKGGQYGVNALLDFVTTASKEELDLKRWSIFYPNRYRRLNKQVMGIVRQGLLNDISTGAKDEFKIATRRRWGGQVHKKFTALSPEERGFLLRRGLQQVSDQERRALVASYMYLHHGAMELRSDDQQSWFADKGRTLAGKPIQHLGENVYEVKMSDSLKAEVLVAVDGTVGRDPKGMTTEKVLVPVLAWDEPRGGRVVTNDFFTDEVAAECNAQLGRSPEHKWYLRPDQFSHAVGLMTVQTQSGLDSTLPPEIRELAELTSDYSPGLAPFAAWTSREALSQAHFFTAAQRHYHEHRS